MAVSKEEKARRRAKAILKREYKKKYRKGSITNAIGIPVAVILILACTVSVISDKVELNEKQIELKALEERAIELEAENASYESILNEEDERTYMERIAIERLGYAYPDERRFYDTTRS